MPKEHGGKLHAFRPRRGVVSSFSVSEILEGDAETSTVQVQGDIFSGIHKWLIGCTVPVPELLAWKNTQSIEEFFVQTPESEGTHTALRSSARREVVGQTKTASSPLLMWKLRH